MPAPLVVVGIVVAVAAKVATVGWAMSIATDPHSEPTRKKLLGHVGDILAKLDELKLSPAQEKVVSLQGDIALLRPNLHVGWVTWREFAAASRLTNFFMLEHIKGTGRGVWTLFGNGADSAVACLFPPAAPEESQS